MKWAPVFMGWKFMGDGILHDSPHSQLYHHNIPILPMKISSIYTSIDNSISPKIPCIWEILMGILWWYMRKLYIYIYILLIMGIIMYIYIYIIICFHDNSISPKAFFIFCLEGLRRRAHGNLPIVGALMVDHTILTWEICEVAPRVGYIHLWCGIM